MFYLIILSHVLLSVQTQSKVFHVILILLPWIWRLVFSYIPNTVVYIIITVHLIPVDDGSIFEFILGYFDII
jgi:hypothetical protein